MLQNLAGATPAPADGLIKDTTTQAFVKDVIEESRRQPVLVDFWAEWCGPCKQLTPVLEKAVKAAKGKVKLVKMDIDKHPAIPGQMGIQSIPAVIAFVNGQPADGFLGALPEGQVTAFIERITKDKLGGDAQDLLKTADAALAAGNAAEAVELYAEVLQEEPGSVPALAGLARAYVETGAHRAGEADARAGARGEAQRCGGRGGALGARSRRAGASRSARSASLNKKSPRIRSTIRRDSSSRSRSTRRASARRRPITCSASSSATANGTRTARASSWSSSSTHGVRPTRRPSAGGGNCRRSCLHNRSSVRSEAVGSGERQCR